MSEPSQTAIQGAVSLVAYRRQLLADALKERASMQRLVRRCYRALDEAERQMSATISADVPTAPASASAVSPGTIATLTD